MDRMTKAKAQRYGKMIGTLSAEAERFEAINLASPRGNTAAAGRARQLRSLIALYKAALIEAGMCDYIPRYCIETQIAPQTTPQITQGDLNRVMQGD